MSGAPKNPMAEIVAICKQRHLYFVPINDKGRRAYVIYRRRPEDDPRQGGIRINKCRGGERALLNMIKRAAGIAPGSTPTPDPKESAF